MKEYKVTLIETVEHKVIVKANNESEIEDKLIEMLENREIDFAHGETVDTQMRIEK